MLNGGADTRETIVYVQKLCRRRIDLHQVKVVIHENRTEELIAVIEETMSAEIINAVTAMPAMGEEEA